MAVHGLDKVGGWPRPRALAAAGLLHGAVVACLALECAPPTVAPDDRAVAVSLVVAPPRENENPPPRLPPEAMAALATGGPFNAAPAAPPPGEQRIAPEAKSARVTAEPRTRPLHTETRRSPSPSVPQAGKRASRHAKRRDDTSRHEPATGPAAAVYGVVVKSTGDIATITLLRSSGRAEFDEAGAEMLRASTRFPPPRSADGDSRYFAVTLRFTPDSP